MTPPAISMTTFLNLRRIKTPISSERYDMKVVIKRARLAFAKIWEPEQFNNSGEPACSGSFILDPKTQKAEVDKVIATITQVANEKWGAKAADMLKTLKAKGDICLHDGATKSEYEGFDGNVFVSARNKARPVVLDTDKSPLTSADGRPYSGCFVDVSLDIWPQENKYGKRINAKLLAIRFVDDGPAFSGGEGYSEADFEDEASAEASEAAGDFFN
jgi:hypothetical protein